MQKFIGAAVVIALACGLVDEVRAQDPKAVVDKAIQALGGEDNLAKVKAATWKTKGKIIFGGSENSFTGATTVDGLDHFRGEFEGDFGGNTIKGVTVLRGDKGWRKFGDNVMEMDKDAVANEKRNVYLQVIPITLVALKGQGFKLAAAGEDKVGGKPAVAIKATGPDGKDFRLFFDKESGLPLKLVAKVVDFTGQEFEQESFYRDFQDFGGIKRATKVEFKRDGEKFLEATVTEFKVLDKVDQQTFAEPK